MRLKLTNSLDSKSGEGNSNARMTNMLKEVYSVGTDFCAIRPALVKIGISSGNGDGSIEFAEDVFVIFGGEVYLFEEGSPFGTFTSLVTVGDSIHDFTQSPI